jgi:hypothetical protein
MTHGMSRRTQAMFTAIVMAIVVATAALDIATGFSYDHWRDTVMATF